MPKSNFVKSWIVSLQRRRTVAALIVIAMLIGGIATFLGNLQKIFDVYSRVFKRPVVLEFSLSTMSVGFEETREPLFAASQKLYRTFGPAYPFVKNPVALFLVTVNNPTGHDIHITKAVYDVEQVGEVRGGPSGPLVSLFKFPVHEISHEVGEQPRELSPPFQVSRGSAASFELEITSASQGIGLGWLLKIGFVSDGGTFYTEEFQLYLPARGGLESRSARSFAEPPSPVGETNGDLLTRRFNIEIPNPRDRDCIFELANVLFDVSKLDAFDRDMLFMRAGYHTPEEFRSLTTETQPPIVYGELIPSEHDRKLLLTLVKSHAHCPD